MKFKLNDYVLWKNKSSGRIVEIKVESLNSYPEEKTILIEQSNGYRNWVYEKDIINDQQRIRDNKINIILED